MKLSRWQQDSAAHLLPSKQPRNSRKWKDDVLCSLCAKGRQARDAWKNASGGPLSEDKNRLRKRFRWCAAKSERQIGYFHKRRYRFPQRIKSRRSKPFVGAGH